MLWYFHFGNEAETLCLVNPLPRLISMY